MVGTIRGDAAVTLAGIDRGTPCARPDVVLTRLAGVAAGVAAGCGLLVPAAYDAPSATVEMLRGYDLVTLVVVTPVLLLTRRDLSPRTPVVRAGMLAYLVYTYLISSITGGLGVAFLPDVAVLSLSLWALGLTLVGTQPSVAPPGGPAPRIAASMLGVLALSLGGMWFAAYTTAVVTGDTPAGSALVETDAVVQLGMVLDLALLVPTYGIASVLLWRGGGWAPMVAGLALVSGLLHQVSYLVAMPFQTVADVPGAAWTDPFEPMIVAAYLVGLIALVKGRSWS